MLSKNKLQYLTSLQNKKFREQYNEFLIEGDKNVSESLRQDNFTILEILALPEWINRNTQLLTRNANIEVTIISEKDLDRISAFKTPNQVLARLSSKDLKFDLQKASHGLSIYLDGVQDPGNVGTIIRTAEWYGIQQVILSPDSVDRYNSKFLQACMGSFFRVAVMKIPFEELKMRCKNIPFWGASLWGENINLTQLDIPGILVMGSEGSGISPEVEKSLDKTIKIPKSSQSLTESLNVAVATGIILDKILAR